MSPKRLVELQSWFCEHDNNWQMDIMEEIDIDSGTIEFWEKLDELYGHNAKPLDFDND